MIPPIENSGNLSFRVILCIRISLGSKRIADGICFGEVVFLTRVSFRYVMLCLTLVAACTILAVSGSRAVTTISELYSLTDRVVFVLDAGHGGMDGGTSTAGGVAESVINLQITLRLNDLLHLLGYDTVMIRTSDISVYTEGSTIAAKKLSDLKERVRIVNGTPNAILVSIHQNFFTDSKYSGAQVFYADTPASKLLAEAMQKNLIQCLQPTSNRQCKQASGIYLMEHIDTCGILIECGFLSNQEEASKLQKKEYQLRLCGVIASTLAVAVH